VQALPFLLAAAAAVLVAPAALRALSAGGFARPNYRGAALPFPAGLVVVAAAVLALVPLALLDEISGADVFRAELRTVAVYALGVAFLGLVDDVFSDESRGWRGHGTAVLSGEWSTGALKAVGSLGLALYALSGLGLDDEEYLLAVAVLVLATNLFNLFDLRPGRSVKAFVLLGLGLTLGTWDTAPLAALGLFAGPVLVLGFFDLREEAMLGDTGSNLIGALAGLWLVLALGFGAQIVAFLVLVALTAYGEFRSISAWVDRTPGIRELDALGRPTPPPGSLHSDDRADA
jgi:UDP-N-acetylmuramyl pentapeptide phosphotransferase/UDP-N-acetylglucosamine-1-phosphate transferase